jgi:hypothetical protein
MNITTKPFYELFSYSVAIYPEILTYTTNCDRPQFEQLWDNWSTSTELTAQYDFSSYLKSQGYEVIVSTPIIERTYVL